MAAPMTTVIIPARNEAKTIGAIVKVFNRIPETRGRIYVGIDGQTTDNTSEEVWANGGCALHTGQLGKGQVVRRVLTMLLDNRPTNLSDRIILCDGDYTGLRPYHIIKIRSHEGMVIGVPDWPTDAVPQHVINSWPRVSGFRYLPHTLIPKDAHGYLLETQINLAAIKAGVPVRMIPMYGLKSPFQWPLTEKRMAEHQRDKKWGEKHGIL